MRREYPALHASYLNPNWRFFSFEHLIGLLQLPLCTEQHDDGSLGPARRNHEGDGGRYESEVVVTRVIDP